MGVRDVFRVGPLAWVAMVGCQVGTAEQPTRAPAAPVPAAVQPRIPEVGPVPRPIDPDQAHATDLGAVTGLQDTFLGYHQRGRALVAADFDQDGVLDFFMGNPGDASLVVRGVLGPEGVRYELVAELHSDHLSWGAAAADYDNDGDLDIFVSGGGNECDDVDLLYRNLLRETGELAFDEVSADAGIQGRTIGGALVLGASANGVWADVDRDGHVDLFVNGNHRVSCGELDEGLARNTLWHNQGDGTFRDITEVVGLHRSLQSTRHSTFFDYDNDGDSDLFEANLYGTNVLWRNMLVETGKVRFERDSIALPEEPVPYKSFASCAGDFDNDGWEDIFVFRRQDGDCAPDIDVPPADPRGHGLFRNEGNGRFEDWAGPLGLNALGGGDGVMGCQIGDLDSNGILDMFLGHGGPGRGGNNQLFLGMESAAGFELVDATALIDFPAPDSGVPLMAPYPYRTHGTAMVDVDNDGDLEMAVSNGGPDYKPDRVREPNRLFDFTWAHEVRTLSVRLSGDGVSVSRDAIGARVRLVGLDADGEPVELHRTLFGGSCFSGQNAMALSFGLARVQQVVALTVVWPDGTVSHHEPPAADRRQVLLRYPGS
jgi:enediyne biosynthesis protein E4